jgi:hypothetical protein
MLCRKNLSLRSVATAVVTAGLLSLLQTAGVEAAQSKDGPVLPPVTGPQDAVTAGQFTGDLSINPIHPWDNNGLTDTTNDLSGPGRARQRLKTPPARDEKRVIEDPERKAVGGATLPEGVESVRNYPNPFNAQTRIEFALSQPGRVTLEIFNLLGQTQYRQDWNHLDAGMHVWLWSGVTGDGKSLPSGIYFYKVELGQSSAIGKMVLLK